MNRIESHYRSLIHAFDKINVRNEDEITRICRDTHEWIAKVQEECVRDFDKMIVRIDQKVMNLPRFNQVKKTHSLLIKTLAKNKCVIYLDLREKNLKEIIYELFDLKKSEEFLCLFEGDSRYKNLQICVIFDNQILHLNIPHYIKGSLFRNWKTWPRSLLQHILKNADEDIIRYIFGNAITARFLRSSEYDLAEILIERQICSKEMFRNKTPLEWLLSSSQIDRTINLFEKLNEFNLKSLHFFCSLGNLDMVKKHIAAGISLDPEDLSRGDKSPLFIALKMTYFEIVKELVKAGANHKDMVTKVGNTALHLAAQRGELEMISLFSEIDINQKNHEGETPIIHAARLKKRMAVLKLLEMGADPKAIDKEGNTLFHLISDREIFEKIHNHVDINAKNYQGETALFSCCSFDDFQLLLEFNADIYIDQKGQSLLYCAIVTLKDDLIIQKLFNLGAEINPTVPEMQSPLTGALLIKNDKLFHKLIKRGAQINPRNILIITPLAQAILSNDKNHINWLIENGAEINPSQTVALTPLKAAIRSGNEEMFYRLIELGAEINPSQLGQSSPMAEAIHYKRYQFVKYLLDKGGVLNDPASDPLVRSIVHFPHAVKLFLEYKTRENHYCQENFYYTLANLHAKQVPGNYSLFVHKLLFDSGIPLHFQDIQPNKGFTFLFLDLMQRGEVETAELMDLHVDGQLSENAKRLLLAHRFAVKGSDSKGFKYEGLWPEFTYPELAESFQAFAEIPGNIDLDDETVREIVETLSFINAEMTDETLWQRYQKGKPVVNPTGWEAHSTATIIKVDQLLHGNKGAKMTDYTISFFKNEHIKKLSKDFFTKSIYTQSHICKSPVLPLQSFEEQKLLFQHHLNIDLSSPIQEESFTTQEQKSGNCTWASAKLALRGLLYLAYKEQYPDSIPDVLKAEVNLIFKKWRLFDLKRGWNQYIMHHKRDGKRSPKMDMELLKKIDGKCIKFGSGLSGALFRFLH